MRRVHMLAALGAAASLALAGCGQAPPADTAASPSADAGANASSDAGASASSAPADAAADFKACMVSDSGGFDDQSFNQSGKEGMDAAKADLGIETVEVESQADTDYATNVDNMVSQNCNLTIGVGFLLEDAIEKAANDNPDTNFALVDSAFSDETFAPIQIDNAKPILFNTAEASFLAGYLAAGMSESGTVATFGGLQIPSVAIFMDGFADGIKKYNEDNSSDVKLLGWDKDKQEGAFSGDFENQSQGKTLTEQFIAQGADIVMPVAGPVGLGAASAAAGADGVRLIWVDSDGYETAVEYKDLMLTSVVKKIGEAVEGTISDTLKGGFTNEPYVGTLENDGVSLAPFHDFDGDVSQELKDKIEEYKQQIVSGDLKIETPNAPTSR